MKAKLASRHRRVLLGTMAGAAAAAALPAGTLAAQSPRRGGTLVYLIDEPPTLVSLMNTGTPQFVSSKVVESLLTYDYDFTPRPRLATAWSVSPDGLHCTFQLRENVRWHDGKPFTAEDVAFSIELAKARHPRGSSTFANLSAVKVAGPHEVVLVLDKPAPYILSALANAETPILPRHLYEGTDAARNPRNNAPVGTGPFIFKEWSRGSHVIYERNPDYWGKPHPYVDRILVRFMPDAAARALAIETGEVHLAAARNLAMAELDRLGRMKHLYLVNEGQEYSSSITELMFNMQRPHFKDLRVRQAFAHAIDRQAVLETCWLGYGILGNGPLRPGSKYYAKDLPAYAFDPAKAEALLDAAGYPRKEGGIRLRVTHDYMPGIEGYKRSADYIKQALARIGVEVSIRVQDFATYVRTIYTQRDFDFAYGTVSNTFDPTVGVQRLYWSKNIRPGVPFSNGAAYANPEVDQLLEAAAVEVDDKKRHALFKRFQEIIAHEIPGIQMLSQQLPAIVNRKLHNPITGAEGLLGDLAEAYMDA